MRPSEDMPLDPVVLAELDAIDATLAGDPVEPEHAELAELALLLQAERPAPREHFTAALDARAARRFAMARPAARAGDRHHARLGRLRRLPRVLLAGGGVGVAMAAAAVVAVVVLNGGNPKTGPVPMLPRPADHAATFRAASSAGAGASGVVGGVAPSPAPGRKVTQSAQLQLNAPSKRINAVAQELFAVAGAEQAIIEHSSISQGSDGSSASFTLGVPAANLQAAIGRLTKLHYAHVASLTNSSSDVTSRFESLNHRLGDAQALRTALLKQLQDATTTQATDSLETQIHDAESHISALQAQLRSLGHRVSYSSVNVQINPSATILPQHGRSGHGLTLGRAAHDAVRVLVVAAGVVLIGSAGLIPVALLVALGYWIGRTIRQRRRERALDQA